MKRPALPLTVILLGLTSMFGDVASEMIFPLLPVFLTGTLGASPAFLGLVEGVADSIASVLKLASGALSDRLRRDKPLVAAGYALSGLARPLVAVAAAPWQVLAVRVTDRVGKGVRTSPRDALLASAVPSSQAGRAFGFHRAMDHVGAVLGPLIATGLLTVGVPMRTVFALAAIPGVVAVVMVLLIRDRAGTHVGAPLAPASSAPAASAKGPPADAPRPRDAPVLRGRFAALLAILVLFNLGHASDAFLLLRAREVGIDAARIPLLWTVFHVAKVALVSLGGRLADRVDRASLLVAALVVSALAWLAFAIVDSPVLVVVLFVFYALYYGLAEPTERALVRDLAPDGARGRAFGWYNGLVGGAALPAGLLIGAAWDTWGGPTALTIGAATSLLAAVALTGWRLARPRTARR